MDLTPPPLVPHHGLGPSTPLLLDGSSLRKGGMPNPPSPSRAAGLGPGMVMGGLEGIQALPCPQCLCIPPAVTLRLPPITCLPLPWGPCRVPSSCASPLQLGWCAGWGLLTSAAGWQVSATGICNGGEGRAELMAVFPVEPRGYRDVVPKDSVSWEMPPLQPCWCSAQSRPCCCHGGTKPWGTWPCGQSNGHGRLVCPLNGSGVWRAVVPSSFLPRGCPGRDWADFLVTGLVWGITLLGTPRGLGVMLGAVGKGPAWPVMSLQQSLPWGCHFGGIS